MHVCVHVCRYVFLVVHIWAKGQCQVSVNCFLTAIVPCLIFGKSATEPGAQLG